MVKKGITVIRNYEEIKSYLAVQGLITVDHDDQSININPEGAQVAFILIALLGAEERKLAQRVEEELDAQDTEIEHVVFSSLDAACGVVAGLLSTDPRFGDAIISAMERLG